MLLGYSITRTRPPIALAGCNRQRAARVRRLQTSRRHASKEGGAHQVCPELGLHHAAVAMLPHHPPPDHPRLSASPVSLWVRAFRHSWRATPAPCSPPAAPRLILRAHLRLVAPHLGLHLLGPVHVRNTLPARSRLSDTARHAGSDGASAGCGRRAGQRHAPSPGKTGCPSGC